METQRIALFGASTRIGERIMNEALSRGHKVTAIVPQPEKIKTSHDNLKVIQGDVMNKNDIGSKIKGHDVVISAYEVKSDPAEHVRYTKNLVEAVNNDDIRQLIVMGHPGVSDLEPLGQTPANAEAWKAVTEAQQQALQTLEDKTNTRWTYVHLPELSTSPGKSGKPETSNRILVKNPESEQYFPVKEYPHAVLDEAEHSISSAQSEL
jgi:putative NADH-flavin reductase